MTVVLNMSALRPSVHSCDLTKACCVVTKDALSSYHLLCTHRVVLRQACHVLKESLCCGTTK